MKKLRFTETRIFATPKEADSGMLVNYNGKSKYGATGCKLAISI